MTNNTNMGFVKVAACSFPVALGDVFKNAITISKKMLEADKEGVQIIVFPELCLTGYTCGDLFLQSSLSRKTLSALSYILTETSDKDILACIGMPIEDHGKLFNCAVWIKNGSIIGVVPKTYIPNYSEFYEKRWFVSSTCRTSDRIEILGIDVPFTDKLLLVGPDNVTIGTEICEDLWVDNPPSGMLSRAGATIIVNPSASNDTIGKREYRRNLVKMQSGRCKSGYIYASSGLGESSTDLVFSGHCMIAENGRMIVEDNDTMIIGTIDVERCVNDRKKYNSETWVDFPYQDFTECKIELKNSGLVLPKTVNPYPFVPSNKEERTSRCEEILNLQSRGLAQRLRSTNTENVVLGLSGGLDSTLALLVCLNTFKMLSLPTENIHCITMPGFGTSKTTRSIVDKLAECFHITLKEISIVDACKSHLKDLGHPLDVYDNVYENTQARERTQILFDYANMVNGLLIGTGDMSELALGWCTYNGDHMSNYAVNTGVPKTLVKYLVEVYGNKMEREGNKDAADVLHEVTGLTISPELLPTDENGNIAQDTEASIGKYDLHDFFLYLFLRNGFSRDKIFELAKIAFRNLVSEEEILSTLDTFYLRFRTQQFKRSCIPDGVKIGTVALSPRGDWRMPSDMLSIY